MSPLLGSEFDMRETLVRRAQAPQRHASPGSVHCHEKEGASPGRGGVGSCHILYSIWLPSTMHFIGFTEPTKDSTLQNQVNQFFMVLEVWGYMIPLYIATGVMTSGLRAALFVEK